MSSYIKNIQKRSASQLAYTTKNMYLYNDVNLPVGWWITIVLMPIILLVVAIIITRTTNLDIQLIAYSVFITPIQMFIIFIGMVIYRAGKDIDVNLFFDKITKVLSINVLKHKTRVISCPTQMRVVVRYYRLYSKGANRKNRILLIAIELMGNNTFDEIDVHYVRFASIQCHTRKEAMDLIDQVVEEYKKIAEWLNIPITKENQKIFIRDTEEKELWYLL